MIRLTASGLWQLMVDHDDDPVFVVHQEACWNDNPRAKRESVFDSLIVRHAIKKIEPVWAPELLSFP